VAACSPRSFERPYAESGAVGAFTSYGVRLAPSKTKSVDTCTSVASTSFVARARNSTADPLIALAMFSFASASSTFVYAAQLMTIVGFAAATASLTAPASVMSSVERSSAITSSSRDASALRRSVPTMPAAPVISQRCVIARGASRSSSSAAPSPVA
jgi:hypothetical protein